MAIRHQALHADRSRPLDGLLAYPAELPVALLEREAAGQYKYDWEASGARSYDNFPLANVTHPCLESTPLMAYARTVTVDVKEEMHSSCPHIGTTRSSLLQSRKAQRRHQLLVEHGRGAGDMVRSGAKRVRANPSARSRGRRHSAGTPGNSL